MSWVDMFYKFSFSLFTFVFSLFILLISLAAIYFAVSFVVGMLKDTIRENRSKHYK